MVTNLKIKSLVVCAIFIVLSPILYEDLVYGRVVKRPVEPPNLIPACLLKWPEPASPHAVLVDKSAQKVYVYHRDNPFEPIKNYPCSTGENDGPKTKQNDRKTPEGIYFFTQAYEQKDLAPIYGVRALPIDYPNPLDIKEGRAGYGIWFHGTNKPLKPRDSNGCIVLENQHMEELTSYIQLMETPVIINTTIEMVPPEKREKDAREIQQLIEDWRSAWEGKDMEKYISFYSSQFSSGGMDREAWKRYKSRLANQYGRISVETQNLGILKNGELVMARFEQRYGTKGFHSEGVKRLYLRQNSTQWKIVEESFREGLEKRAAIDGSVLEKTKPTALDEIRIFLHQWRAAWQEKDLKAYMACYDRAFQSRGMDLKAWENHRDDLNRHYRSVKVEIHDLKIFSRSDQSAGVRFTQHYRADNYRDDGLKEMDLIKKGRDWKILKEEWQPLPQKARR